MEAHGGPSAYNLVHGEGGICGFKIIIHRFGITAGLAFWGTNVTSE